MSEAQGNRDGRSRGRGQGSAGKRSPGPKRDQRSGDNKRGFDRKPRDGKSFGRNKGDNNRSFDRKSGGFRSGDSHGNRGGKPFDRGKGDGEKRDFDRKPRDGKPFGHGKGGEKRSFDRTPRDGKSFGRGRGDGEKRPFKPKRDFDRKPRKFKSFEAQAVVEEAAPALVEATSGKRAWVPNRVQKPKTSKREFDQKKVKNLVDADRPAYKGELDPRQKDPNRKPRAVSRSEEKVRAKAERLAENDPSLAARKEVKITDFRDQFERNDASPGRLGALYATNQVRRRKAYAQEVIEATIDRSTLTAQDRAFATLLTLGVVSTSGALDEVINRCIASPKDIKNDVRDALRISTYEIIYLRKAPHAAVDQGVELVRAVAPSAAGLANAVLHRILNAAETFPFGDPAKNLEALALAYAFPVWMARMLIEDMGAQAASGLMQASNDPAPLYIHVNALQATDAEIAALFEEAGATLEPVSAGGVTPPGCYSVSNSRVLTDGRIRRAFNQGKVLVSDAAAQAVVECILENGAPESLLEIGAGRGTKTIMLQSMAMRKFGKQLNLTPMDSHAFKTDLLRDRAKQYGVRLEGTVTGNATRLDAVIPDSRYDTIFIDAPCSGLGTLRRHQDIRWRIEQDKMADLVETDLGLLKSAAGHIADGGSIIYATCTVTYAENYGVVKKFLESDEGSNFTLAPIMGKSCFTSVLTPGSPDAHFAVKFVRKA